MAEVAQEPTTALATTDTRTVPQKFADKVQRLFKAEFGLEVQWSELQNTLAQHMFVGVDQWMKKHNADDRNSNNQMSWERIDQQQLAMDSVHRISMELDALIPNHIHPVPYKAGHTGLVRLDLRIGYEGLMYTRMRFCVDPPLKVTMKLLHKGDRFREFITAGGIDSFEYEAFDSLNPGEITGGFYYFSYANPRKNKLKIVPMSRFKIARDSAMTKTFWDAEKSKIPMHFKTLVTVAMKDLPLDPRKVNGRTIQALETSSNDFILADVEDEIAENANGEVIGITMDQAATDLAAGVQTGEIVDATTETGTGDPF